MKKREPSVEQIDPRWAKVLKVSHPKSDTLKWSLGPIQRVKQSFSPHTFSKKTARDVIRYFEETIQAQKVERAFMRRWSPKVYHRNTLRHLEFEEKTMKTVSQCLKKEVAR